MICIMLIYSNPHRNLCLVWGDLWNWTQTSGKSILCHRFVFIHNWIWYLFNFFGVNFSLVAFCRNFAIWNARFSLRLAEWKSWASSSFRFVIKKLVVDQQNANIHANTHEHRWRDMHNEFEMNVQFHSLRFIFFQKTFARLQMAHYNEHMSSLQAVVHKFYMIYTSLIPIWIALILHKSKSNFLWRGPTLHASGQYGIHFMPFRVFIGFF